MLRRPALLLFFASCVSLIAFSCGSDHQSAAFPRAPTPEGVYRGSEEGKFYTPVGDTVRYSVCAEGDEWTRPGLDDQRRHLASLGGEFSQLAWQGYLLQPGWLWTFVGETKGEQYALARSGLWTASPDTSACDRSAGLTLLIEHAVSEMRFDGETVWMRARYVPGYFQYVEYSLPANIRAVSYQLIAEDGTWVDACCT